MVDFFELEKRCKKIRQKKIFKIVVIIFFVIIAVSLICVNTLTPKKIDKNTSYPKAIAKIDKNTSYPKAIAKIDKNISRPIPILKIDIDFNNIPTTSSSIPPKKVIKKEQNKTIIKEKLSILQSEALTFTKALKLAQLYYNNGDYQNSIKWCKLASKIDNNDERIWKLYALNLEKIGQKDKAIKVLKTYLKYKNSIELKYLLQRLSQ
jgi:tetratricopeptide (TPR) repeat protein